MLDAFGVDCLQLLADNRNALVIICNVQISLKRNILWLGTKPFDVGVFDPFSLLLLLLFLFSFSLKSFLICLAKSMKKDLKANCSSVHFFFFFNVAFFNSNRRMMFHVSRVVLLRKMQNRICSRQTSDEVEFILFSTLWTKNHWNGKHFLLVFFFISCLTALCCTLCVISEKGFQSFNSFWNFVIESLQSMSWKMSGLSYLLPLWLQLLHIP